jgi:hypothetical protein
MLPRTEAASDRAVPDELRCTYRSKPCLNERARKRNGTFHKLCQEHRLRANENQRNMQRRLRERRRREEFFAEVEAATAATAATAARGASSPENSRQDEFAPLDEDEDVDEWGLYAIEPLAEPEDLRAEDLEVLKLFWEKKEAQT